MINFLTAIVSAWCLQAAPAVAQCEPEGWVYGRMQDYAGSGVRNAIILDGATPLMLAAGEFELAGRPASYGLATWDGENWTPYPAGGPPVGEARCVCINDGTLYVGGSFSNLNGGNGSLIARWNGTQWVASGAWLTGSGAYDMVSANGVLYAAGDLAINAVSAPVVRLVNGFWESAGITMSGRPSVMTEHQGGVYVAGSITGGSGLSPCKLAAYVGGTWSAIDAGLPITVIGLRSVNGELFATGGMPGEMTGRVYRRVGGAWQQVGQDLPSWAADVAFYQGEYFTVAGHPNNFTHAPLYHLTGATWTAIAGTMEIDTDNGRTCLLVRGDELLLTTRSGLVVDASADRSFNTILRAAGSYRPSTGWQPTLQSFGLLQCLAATNNTLVAGCSIVARPALPPTTVATFDTANGWRAVPGLSGYMYEISAVPFNGSVLIGGSKDSTSLPRYQPGLGKLVRWNDGASWPMKRGLWDSNTDSSGGHGGPNIKAIAEYKGRVYAAPINLRVYNSNVSLVWWDGQEWQPAGRTPNGIINSMCVYGGKLIVGGSFSAIGSVDPTTPAANIMAFDGNAWTPLGAGLAGQVKAVEVYNGRLYAAGDFTGANPVPGVPAATGGIACWDGERWRGVGAGLVNPNNTVGGGGLLRTYAGKLYVGGTFVRSGSTTFPNLARFDGANLQPFGGFVDFTSVSSPIGLSVFDGELYISGNFRHAGGLNSAGVARWRAPQVPEILSVPSRVLAAPGGVATIPLTLAAAPLSAQWSRVGGTVVNLQDGALPSGAVVSGAQSPVLTISGVTPAEYGDYRCTLVFECGTVYSGLITIAQQ